MNKGTSSQLGMHRFDSLHNLTWTRNQRNHNEDILLQHLTSLHT